MFQAPVVRVEAFGEVRRPAPPRCLAGALAAPVHELGTLAPGNRVVTGLDGELRRELSLTDGARNDGYPAGVRRLLGRPLPQAARLEVEPLEHGGWGWGRGHGNQSSEECEQGERTYAEAASYLGELAHEVASQCGTRIGRASFGFLNISWGISRILAKRKLLPASAGEQPRFGFSSRALARLCRASAMSPAFVWMRAATSQSRQSDWSWSSAVSIEVRASSICPPSSWTSASWR